MEDFMSVFRSFPISSEKGADALPPLDMVENDKIYKFILELPGMGSEDVTFNINDTYLAISGEKREEKEDNETIIRNECYYGKYIRRISLPKNADIEQAKATFKKGILLIIIPKKESAQKKSHILEITNDE
jgi:HSP20 family protein